MSTSREAAYLGRMLRMNPREQWREILAVRRAFLRADDAEPGAPLFEEDDLPIHQRRRRAAERVAALRGEFWRLDKQTLLRRCDELSVSEFPDLVVAVRQLRAVAARREAFGRLGRHPVCFPEFVEAFRRLAIAAPRQAVRLRADELERAWNGLPFPHSRSPDEYRRIAQVVVSEFPELAVLEEEWLRQIIKGPRRFVVPENSTDVVLTAAGCLMMLLGAVVVLFLLQALIWQI